MTTPVRPRAKFLAFPFPQVRGVGKGAGLDSL
jgi:hypothetical protein